MGKYPVKGPTSRAVVLRLLCKGVFVTESIRKHFTVDITVKCYGLGKLAGRHESFPVLQQIAFT